MKGMDTRVVVASEAMGMAAAAAYRPPLLFHVYNSSRTTRTGRRRTRKHITNICQHRQHQIVNFELGFGSGIIRIRNRSNDLGLGFWDYGIRANPLRLRKIRQVTMSCKARQVEQSTSESQTVYQGAYGLWTIEPSDIREVFLYRAGLVTAAASFVVATCTAFLPPDSSLAHSLQQNLDFLLVSGAAGLGLSLYFIHIYVSEIKLTIQALWALGVIGCLTTYTTLARPAGLGLVQYVVVNPAAVWFVGPVFAALTGLVFKEGLCYGKLEAGLLTFIIPAVLLGHLTGVMDDGIKLSLLGVWMALFIIFAGRKFTQPVKDDIGDKSVFMFNSLVEEEKAALLERLEQ